MILHLVRRLRMAVLLALALVSLVARVAGAQAPPASFFAGRSNDDLRQLALDRHNDVLLRRAAATKLVVRLADDGELDAAETAAREFAGNIDPLAVQHIRAVRRRRHVHAAALVALGLTFALLLSSLAVRRRSLTGALASVRRVAPVVTFFFAFAGAVGGYIATTYENGSAEPFLIFAAIMIPFAIVLRVWSFVGSPRLPARSARVVVALAGTLAIGFLVVEQVNPTFLQNFGL